MYYYVREPNKSATGNPTEGFATRMELESELIDGQLCIDGNTVINVQYGDHITIESRPEYRLKCIKFIL